MLDFLGLLTVEAKHRLTLQDLSSHPWFNTEHTPSTPLQTSCVLGQSKTTASALKQTFHAFHQATKAGFTLGDVSRAPLAKRRKNKRSISPRNGGGGGEQGDKADEVDGSVSSSTSSESQTPIPSRRPSKLDLTSFCYET